MSLRETDADWIVLGADEPYHGVLSQEKFLRRNLTPEILEEFWATGEEEIGYLAKVLTQHFGAFESKRALDFGCGVGRLTRALSRRAAHVTGVDISAGMLAEARRHELRNVDFVMELTDQTFDWINTIIVFQHIPPQRGYVLFEDLLQRLEPGGVLSAQFTLFKDQAFIAHALSGVQAAIWDGDTLRVMKQEEAGPGTMMMFDYDLNRIIALLTANGVEQMFLEHTNHGGCHGVRLFARRAA